MNILIAPNAFKNSLDAASVAAAIETGLLRSTLKCDCIRFPVGDGGDGTAEILVQRFEGRKMSRKAQDPLGRTIGVEFGLIEENKTAVIEMADVSGLKLLKGKELDPLHATSFGTGELIRNALDKQVKKIILCIGGSATVDGGTGALRALGIRFLDQGNNVLNSLPAELNDLATIDLSALDKRIFNCEIVVLCDVENALLGEHGAAKIFGPQKGATEADVQKLETALNQFCDIVLQQAGKDMASIRHGGAAGGIAASFATLLNAELVNGIDYFLNITEFDKALTETDLVITGEGSIDEQTLRGKGPYGVAKRAKQKGVPVIALAGR
ncbi:MAG TPA: glycerate kinase, partial [Parafilimonas sp.]|nr:glycerate kinase [Parafilimonas sp.]